MLAWLAVIVLLLAGLYVVRRYWATWRAEPAAPHTSASTLFGLDIAPESLPADVAGAALAAAESGRAREALSLLYRGALSVLIESGALEVAPGNTEGDCVRQVAASGAAARAQYFAQLVAAWQAAAYARRVPTLTALRGLCGEWRVHFENESAT